MGNPFNPDPVITQEGLDMFPSAEELEQLVEEDEDTKDRIDLMYKMLNPLAETGIDVNAPEAAPGKLPMFAKGVAESFGVDELLGDYTDDWGTRGLEATSGWETGTNIGGLAVGTLAQMAVLRPNAYAVVRAAMTRSAMSTIGPQMLGKPHVMRGLLGGNTSVEAVMAEWATGAGADSAFFAGKLISEEGVDPADLVTIAAANLVGSIFFPGNMEEGFLKAMGQTAKKKAAGEVTADVGVKETLDNVAEHVFAKIEYEKLETFKPDAESLFTTPGAKAAYNKQPNTFTGAVDVINKQVDEYTKVMDNTVASVKKQAYKPVAKYQIPVGQAEEYSIASAEKLGKDIVDEMGGLTPMEVEDVVRKLDSANLRAIQRTRIEKSIRQNAEVNAHLLEERVRGSRASRYDKTVNEWLTTAETRDSKLLYNLNPDIPTRSFERFVPRYQELRKEGKHALSTGLVGIKNDLRVALNLLKDPKVPQQVPAGFGKSVEAKEFFNNFEALTTMLRNDTSVLSEEFKKIGQQLKRSETEMAKQYMENVSLKLAAQPTAVMRRYETLIDALEHGNTKEFMMGTDLTQINTAMRESLAKRLRHNFHLVDDELGAQVTRLEDQLQFIPAEQQLKAVNELDNMSMQLVDKVMQDPTLARRIADTTTDPRLQTSINTWHALLGDPTSTAVVRDAGKNPAKVLNNSLDNKAREIDAARLDAEEYRLKEVEDMGSQPTPSQQFQSPEGNAGAGMRPETIVDNLKENQNWFLRYFESPITHATVQARNAKNVQVKAMLERTVEEMKGLVEGNRAYTKLTNDLNKELDEIIKSWESMGSDGRAIMRKMVDAIALESDTMYYKGKKTTEEIEDWIADRLSKQSPEIQDNYKLFRDYEDKLLKIGNDGINEQNRLLGTAIPQIERRAGHVRFSYEGQWVASMRTKGVGGKPGQWATVVFDDNEQLAAGLNDLLKQGKISTSQLDEFKLEPKWYTQIGDYDIADSVLKDAEAFGIDMAKLRDAFDIHATGFSKDTIGDVVFGAMKPRTMGIEALRSRTEIATAISSRLTARSRHLTIPAVRLRGLANELDAAGLKTTADDLRSYANDVLGRTGDLEGKVDNFVKGMVDHLFNFEPSRIALESAGISHSGRVVREFAGMMNFFGRMMTIGFNPASAMIQWLILPTNVGVVLGHGNVLRGLRHIPEFTKPGRLHDLATRGGVYLAEGDGTWSGVFKRSGKGAGSGIGFQEQVTKPRTLMTKPEKFKDAADYYSMTMFNNSENMIRSASLYAGILDAEKRSAKLVKGAIAKSHQDKRLVKIAKQLNKDITDEAVHDQYALDMMIDLNFDFNPTGLSRFARNPFTKVGAQFKTYFAQELEFLTGRKMELTHMERFQSLGMFAAFGGVMALPFAEDVNTLATYVYGRDPKQWFMENLPDAFLGGFPAVAGVNFTGPIALGGAETFSVLGNGFLQGVTTSKLHQMFNRVQSGKYTIPQAALGSNVMLTRIADSYEMLSTGNVTRGGKVTAEGGAGTAALNVLGVKSQANKRKTDQYYLDRAELEMSQRATNKIKRDILGTDKKDRVAKAKKYIAEGKVTTAVVKRWFTEFADQ